MFPKDAVCGGVGKVSKVIDALSQEKAFEYVLAGNLVLTTDAQTRSTAYEYDALNRMTAIESPAASRTSG